jgi:hypothetical protein
VLVGYFKYKRAFAMLGAASCLSLLLTLLQLLHERTRSVMSYDNIEEENMTGHHMHDADTKEEVFEGDVEMTTRSSRDASLGSAGSGTKDPPVLHPPFALKLLLSSFFFVYVGIEIGYGGEWEEGAPHI